MKKTFQIRQLEKIIKDYGFTMVSITDNDEVKEYVFIKDRRKTKKTIWACFKIIYR